MSGGGTAPDRRETTGAKIWGVLMRSMESILENQERFVGAEAEPESSWLTLRFTNHELETQYGLYFAKRMKAQGRSVWRRAGALDVSASHSATFPLLVCVCLCERAHDSRSFHLTLGKLSVSSSRRSL